MISSDVSDPESSKLTRAKIRPRTSIGKRLNGTAAGLVAIDVRADVVAIEKAATYSDM